MKNISAAVGCIRMFMNKMKSDHVDAYAAQSAFYVIMGFIPFIMLLLILLQYTPLTQEDMMNMFMSVLPESLSGMVRDIVDSLFIKSSALLSGTAIAAVWASGKAILAISNGLNSIYDIDETRNYVVMRIRSSFYILVMLISLVLAMGLLVFGNQIHLIIIEHAPFLQNISGFIISIRTVTTLILLTMLFTAMYTMLPNVRQRFFVQIPGAATAAISWSVFSYGFSLYLNYVHGMSAIYGSLTTAVMLMLWLYFCMWLLFLGAEINFYLDSPESFRLTDGGNMLK